MTDVFQHQYLLRKIFSLLIGVLILVSDYSCFTKTAHSGILLSKWSYAHIDTFLHTYDIDVFSVLGIRHRILYITNSSDHLSPVSAQSSP